LSANNLVPTATTQAARGLGYPKARPDFLPWLPKNPSAFHEFTDVVHPAQKETVYSLLSRVSAEVRASARLYACPGGFALVTDLDRIADNAAPLDEKRHVPPETRDSDWHFSIPQLFNPTRVRSRIAVYLLTSDPLQFDAALMTYVEARRWLASGQASPSTGVPNLGATVTQNHKLYLLVYEFFGSEGSLSQEFVQRSAIKGINHLINSRIRLR
jgi:hypothetical protein